MPFQCMYVSVKSDDWFKGSINLEFMSHASTHTHTHTYMYERIHPYRLNNMHYGSVCLYMRTVIHFMRIAYTNTILSKEHSTTIAPPKETGHICNINNMPNGVVFYSFVKCIKNISPRRKNVIQRAINPFYSKTNNNNNNKIYICVCVCIPNMFTFEQFSMRSHVHIVSFYLSHQAYELLYVCMHVFRVSFTHIRFFSTHAHTRTKNSNRSLALSW